MKWLYAFPISTVLLAQTVIPNGAPASHVFDGRIDEWRTLPPTFVLRSTTGGRNAKVWVRQVPEGLLIAGEVLGGAPDFPDDAGEMLQKDHVEVWLAPVHAPVFPKVGWGNMFGPVIVNNRQDCVNYGNTHMHQWVSDYAEDCDGWLADVAKHRPLVARLFVRQFLLSPGLTVEAYAQPALEKIVNGYSGTQWESLNPSAWPIVPPLNDLQQKDMRPLKPGELPSFKAVPIDGGYGFESLVPWESMPPLTSLDLKSLRLMVDVFSADQGAQKRGPSKNQPFSTSSPTRRYGVSSTMNLVQFAAGRKFHVTACEYPLQEMDLPWNEPVPAFFRPTAADEVMTTMILRNAYGYHSFTPEGDSPDVDTLHHWQQPLAGIATNIACGATLAVRDAAGIHRLTTEGDKDTVAGLSQPDGAYLLNSGPTVNQDFDSTALDPCMECQVVDLYIWLVTPLGQPKQMLELHEKAGNQYLKLDRDIQLSADWSKVTIYRETSREPSEWESETMCRQGLGYKSCGKVAHSSPPPLPRVVEPVPH